MELLNENHILLNVQVTIPPEVLEEHKPENEMIDYAIGEAGKAAKKAFIQAAADWNAMKDAHEENSANTAVTMNNAIDQTRVVDASTRFNRVEPQPEPQGPVSPWPSDQNKD